MPTRTILSELRQPGTALSTALALGGLAPSVHNTQPWRWHTGAGVLDLWAECDRQLTHADPDGRLLVLSCGAALHHARVALAAQGYRGEVLPFPDPAEPDHLARLRIAGGAPVSAATARLYDAIGLRGTDRRPYAPGPVHDDALLAITLAVRAEGCFLQPLRRDQVIELAAAVAHAQQAQAADDAWRAEMARWAGGTRPSGTGVPDGSIPDRETHTTVPGRDFGRPGTLSVDDGHDRWATYAILYGEADEPVDWLAAGQALSAAWLTATDLEVSVLPVSAPVEVPVDRLAVRRLLAGLGYPYLVLRLGDAGQRRPPAATPRLPVEAIVGDDYGR